MIVYLDFDGVLHPDSVFQDPVHGVVLRHEGETQGTEKLMEWAPVLVNILDTFPDIKIILSTSWVHVMGFDFARSALPDDLQARVIGFTQSGSQRVSAGPYSVDIVELSRYQQIKQHVDANNFDDRWLAIDNDAAGWDPNHRNHLVHTDDWKGLGDPAAQEDLKQKLTRFQRRLKP